MPPKISVSHTGRATPAVAPAEPSSSSSSANTLATIIKLGDLRNSLVAIRDRLADELDDIKWAKHKRECTCLCGMSDIRAYVSGTKRLEDVLMAIAALPDPEVRTELDRIADVVADLGEHRRSRTSRRPSAASS